MGGIQIGDNFVSSAEAKENIVQILQQMVGPVKHPKTGKPMKPDLVFAMDVILRTVPKMVLNKAKKAEYERAIDTLFGIRDELSQMITALEICWHIEKEDE